MPMISGKPPLPEEDDEIVADIGDSDVVHTDEPSTEEPENAIDDEPEDDDEYEPNDDL